MEFGTVVVLVNASAMTFVTTQLNPLHLRLEMMMCQSQHKLMIYDTMVVVVVEFIVEVWFTF